MTARLPYWRTMINGKNRSGGPRHASKNNDGEYKNNTDDAKARHVASTMVLLNTPPYRALIASVLSVASLAGLVAINNAVTPDSSITPGIVRASDLNAKSTNGGSAVSRSYTRESLTADDGKWDIGSDEREVGNNLIQQADEQTRKIEKQKADAAYNKTFEDIIQNAKAEKASDIATKGYAFIDKVPLTLDNAKAMDGYNDKIPSGFDRNHATGDNGNAYEFSQCTWYAYKRRHELGLPAGSHMGNGQDWGDTGRSLGYWVDNTPMAGDAVSFPAGKAGADGYYGHVAIVEYVSPIDGTVLTSESGSPMNGDYYSRIFTAQEAAKYAYVHL